MITKFSVTNYKSVSNAELNLKFAEKRAPMRSPTPTYIHFLPFGRKYRVAPIQLLYGPNGSGKSNIINAIKNLAVLAGFLSAAPDVPHLNHSFRPFWYPDKINNQYDTAKYVVEFTLNQYVYIYSIEFNNGGIINETLYSVRKGNKIFGDPKLARHFLADQMLFYHFVENKAYMNDISDAEVFEKMKKWDFQNLDALPMRYQSRGTRKTFNMLKAALYALKHGKTLLVDDLDSDIHPVITMQFIKMFTNKDCNKTKAQLICVLKDTSALSIPNLNTSEVSFVSNFPGKGTQIQRLCEFKDVNRHDNFEKLYTHGCFGAVPIPIC